MLRSVGSGSLSWQESWYSCEHLQKSLYSCERFTAAMASSLFLRLLAQASTHWQPAGVALPGVEALTEAVAVPGVEAPTEAGALAAGGSIAKARV